MRFSRGDQIAGLPAAQARDVIRLFKSHEQPASACKHLLDDDPNAQAVISSLVSEGFLEQVSRNDSEPWYLTTVRGNALAQASFARPIKRATAERQLNGVLERVRANNAHPGKLLTITEVFVFGSYLDPAVMELGDLDLSVQISTRHAYEDFRARRDEAVPGSGGVVGRSDGHQKRSTFIAPIYQTMATAPPIPTPGQQLPLHADTGSARRARLARLRGQARSGASSGSDVPLWARGPVALGGPAGQRGWRSLRRSSRECAAGRLTV